MTDNFLPPFHQHDEPNLSGPPPFQSINLINPSKPTWFLTYFFFGRQSKITRHWPTTAQWSDVWAGTLPRKDVTATIFQSLLAIKVKTTTPYMRGKKKTPSEKPFRKENLFKWHFSHATRPRELFFTHTHFSTVACGSPGTMASLTGR